MAFNATYLFEKPLRKFHNSESWWTAYFSLLVLWLAASQRPATFPTYHADAHGNLARVGSASFSNATFQNLVADARLSAEAFGVNEWPNEYMHLRPDITYFVSQVGRHVIFVETKTIGASVKGNFELYARLSDYLRTQGWIVDLYYLLSAGHEEKMDWPLLAKASAQIITWEDVFSMASETPFGKIFGEPIINYMH